MDGGRRDEQPLWSLSRFYSFSKKFQLEFQKISKLLEFQKITA